MLSFNFALTPDGRRAFLFLMAAIVITSVHHVYRMGPAFLPTVLMALLVPLILVAWYRQSGQSFILRILGGSALLVYVSVGIFDGFLDHTLKALGLPRFYLLPGSEADVVATYYNVLPVEVGHLFYEWTGIATFVLGSVAAFYSVRLLQNPRQAALS